MDYLLSDGRKLVIRDDEWIDSPRDWDNDIKLCIRKYKRYDFPNELDFDFDDLDDGGMDGVEMSKLMKQYYIFRMDCYEHSGISFSLSGGGMQCQFDTSNAVGFIAVPKEFYPDGVVAKKIALEDIKIYNQYCNNECYMYDIYREEEWTNSQGEKKTEWEHEDTCGQYLSEDDILSEFKDLSPTEM